MTYSNMGIALSGLGRHDEALQRFDQALSLDPALENVRANREALLEALQGKVTSTLQCTLVAQKPSDGTSR